MKMNMNYDLDRPFTDLAESDRSAALLRDIYNTGTSGRRLTTEAVLTECRHYYPDHFTIQDVIDDLVAMTPTKALMDVQRTLYFFRTEAEGHGAVIHSMERNSSDPEQEYDYAM